MLPLWLRRMETRFAKFDNCFKNYCAKFLFGLQEVSRILLQLTRGGLSHSRVQDFTAGRKLHCPITVEDSNQKLL